MSKSEPRWDIDYERGLQAELWIKEIREALKSGTVEVKHDERAADTGNVYVEYKCLRQGEYKPSGISTTEAKAWVFVIKNPEFAIVVETNKLKELAKRAAQNPKNKKECTEGTHPTKGVVIALADIIQAFRKAPPKTDKHPWRKVD